MDYITSVEQILAPGVAFPPAGQVSTNARQNPGRLDVMGQNKLLYDGKHESVYEDWDRLTRADQSIVELVVNFQRRLSRLWKSLLLTEPPTITANKEAQDWVDQIVKASRLVGGLGSVVIDQSRWGVGLLKTSDRTGTGEVIIKAQPAYIGDGQHHSGGWFPIVDPLDLQEVTAHVLAWTEARRESILGVSIIRKYLHAEIHTRGFVQNQTWTMDGNIVKRLVEDATVATGHDGFLLSPAFNGQTSDNPHGTDDYQDLDSLLHAIELRLSQLDKILDKHSDPNMQGPQAFAGGISPGQAAAQAQAQSNGSRVSRAAAQGPQVTLGGKYFGRSNDDAKVEYVTWDPNTAAIQWEVETLLDLVYLLSETSPAAFGKIEGGVASGTALKRLLMAPLLKVSDMRNSLDECLQEALMAANALARAASPSVPALTDLKVEWKDGLPQDKTEDANVETVMRGAGLASRESSIQRVYGLEGDALKEELKRIDKEEAAAAPKPQPSAQDVVDAARGVVPPVPPVEPVQPDNQQ